ncbi:MAG: hypothetical protein IJT88_02540 [Kiritimatiellae bacterium]|nr:hypothetical protein [Kiritimatiellia bacterium]
MNAREYYRQAHEIPAVIYENDLPVVPHAEDSGPSGRVCFRRGTHQTRTDVVCKYPGVEGSLDFWAVSRPVGGDSRQYILIGEDVPLWFDGNSENLPIYKRLHDQQVYNFDNYKDASDWDQLKKNYRVYAPRVRCSRLAFVGGLGYGPGEITLPANEHPVSGAPTPTSDTFLGWYGFDSSNRWSGLIRQIKTEPDSDTYEFAEEGWGRPAFDFTPLANHAGQDWAYAPATPSRVWDTRPVKGTTWIERGAWEFGKHPFIGNEDIPIDDILIPNWWLLGMIGGDPQHGKKPGSNPPTPAGKATPLYWNLEKVKSLTYFGEAGTDDLTTKLYLTILRRIYASHCKTPEIDPLFAGIAFPPGFLVDVRILAETWECKCSDYLCFANQEDACGYERGSVKVFSTKYSPVDETLKHYIYLGTHFVVDYKCPFPLWRRQAA